MPSRLRPEVLCAISTSDEQDPSPSNVFREKLADLGLLSAKMINYSRSPWASPIVVIIKKNGVDIRLCIDYRLPDTTDGIPNALDQRSTRRSGVDTLVLFFGYGEWILGSENDGSRSFDLGLYHSFFGLFEWNRMPFGLKNAPQIYQRMIDNALYGFTRIPKAEDHESTLDLRTGNRWIQASHRSYIDDILIPANNWDQLCDRVEGLLEACDKWNLSISVVKSFWGMSKVEYLGHKFSHNGLEANPKDLSALTDLAFPKSLRAM
ncbi:LOW QUALITY PROTEIN: reverse transcriptase [Phytophthora megakarya]|uniref:Reverse transcriptase n=1 Tax=Phytophthora megakarya TaxID=4795 RepID=A0A225UD02_9STRA|nr:LOW QUALITY PROTEIN: reverse transcriptase [Phytophthora megakarya]